MRSYLKNAVVPFKISAAMVAGLCGLEAAGFHLAGVPFRYSGFLLAIALGMALALVFAAAAAGLVRLFRQFEPSLARLASVCGSLALLYLLLVLWLRSFAFTSHHPRWFSLLGLMALLLIVAGLGRMLWYYLTSVYSDLVTARFQALAPMSVLCVGLYSVAQASITDRGRLTLSILVILLLFVIGQYTAIRVIWSSSRTRFVKWGGRLQIVLIAAVPVWALFGAALEYRDAHRPGTAPAGSPSVILITIDTLRADYVTPNNPAAPPTPAIAAFAKDSINFTHVMAPGDWTVPSVSSLVTGLSPRASGGGFLLTHLEDDYTGPLPEALTLAQVFADQGYVTAGFVTNAWLNSTHGFDKGFRFYEVMGDASLSPPFLIARGFKMVYLPFRPLGPFSGSRLTRRALQWLEHRPAGPFFLWLHYIDPHLTYLAHPEYPVKDKPGPRGLQFAMSRFLLLRTEAYELGSPDVRFVRERYGGEVQYEDEQVGRVISWLRGHGLYQDNLVVLSADHGEELWEHETFTHGQNFYDVTIHVPLMVKLPGEKHAGTVVTPWVSDSRLGATILQAAGIKSRFPGTSLLACLDGPLCGDTTLFGRFWTTERSLFGPQTVAVGDRDGKKAIFFYDGTMKCFDLAADPEEKHPFGEADCPWPRDAPGPREVLKTFQENDQKIFRGLGGETAALSPAGAEERKRLKALGYLQ
jgi:arylsulfatase A-like enzyme